MCRVSVCVTYEWEGIGGLGDAGVYVHVYDIDSCTSSYGHRRARPWSFV